MDINQLTANIHQKQAQLEQQIGHLQQQLAAASGEAADKLTQELSALEGLRDKLVQSHAIALRAHALQAKHRPEKAAPHNPTPHNQRRIIGLALCAFSGLGLLTLAIIALLR